MLETSARRPGVRVGAVGLLVALVVALLASGCSQDKPSSAPRPSPTPLASLNTSAMQVPRIDFCKLVPDDAVHDALAGKPDDSVSYGNGDEVDLPGLGTQVVHEIGCGWSTDSGVAARAWVFARPVDAAFARRAVASSRRAGGCRVGPGPSYGEPSVTQTCRPADGGARVRHAGLFGQTWLSCEVTDPRADVRTVRDRADAWCVEVANALNTGG